MATSEATLSASTTLVHEKADESVIPTMRLKLKKPKSKKKVAWTADTVDNEHMNKKKSKCCCIYEKPRAFGESSSESDDECDHCRGHVEKKSSQLKSHDEEHTTLLPVGAAKGK